MKMTIEEAIEKYQRLEKHTAEHAKQYMDDHETKAAELYMTFAAEHRQIIDWLEELKRRREGDTKKKTSIETIDDAISKFEKDAESQLHIANTYTKEYEEYVRNKFEEAAENLTQIAEWLKQLKGI